MYIWTVQNVENPSDGRYIYSANRNKLTIESVERQDSSKVFACRAREVVDNDLTSKEAEASFDVQCKLYIYILFTFHLLQYEMHF